MLVNGVELFDYRKGKVWKAEDNELREMVTANTYPMVFMMRFLGPQMKERKEKRSAIINLTSMYLLRGGTYQLPIFSAGKAM